jgi:GAF domain-containing protein
MRHAVEHGNLSSLSVPLVIDGDVSGSLNIYARQANAFDDDARSAAIGFAPYAAVAVKNMHDHEAAQVRARELAAGTETPAAIDQATGILMERHAMTADEAFRLLSEVSARTGTTLREAAHVLVDTGEMPELARP